MIGEGKAGYLVRMTEPPLEPNEPLNADTGDVPEKPKAPDLPDPAFPEVLPGARMRRTRPPNRRSDVAVDND